MNFRSTKRIGAGVCLCFLLFCCNSPAADRRPFAKIDSPVLDEARWTSGFWIDRFERCRTNILPNMGRLMEGTNYSQFLRNFEIAAGLAEGRQRGAPFNDGEVYKLIQAASATYAVAPNDYFRRNLDKAIAIIAKAQRSDGYLHTPTLIRAQKGDTNAVPFADRTNFEMYNLGHLFTAACVHHQATGQTNLLAVAVKAADFLQRTFSETTPEGARSSICPSHYMGIIDLYRETGEARYLELAKKFFALRSQITDGGDDNQDRIPFEQQTNAMGHAVRGNYLYAGAADLFMETGDESFWKPLEPIWTNLVAQKMYITGGCGALYDGASPDGAKEQKSITRVHQAYGRNYQLPNTTAHSETCANIGNVLWNWRMFRATGEGRFMDVLELALYNSVLSGVGLDGTNFFYTNPLRVTDPLPTDLRWPRTRVPFVSSYCCPPNVARTIASSANYAYGKSSGTIWVNLYGSSKFATKLDGDAVKLTQETEYPWNGRVRITLNEVPGREFSLKLRVPGWAKEAAVRINNGPSKDFRSWSEHSDPSPLIPLPSKGRGRKPAERSEEMRVNGGYVELHRAWKSGDTVDLDLRMDTELIEANPLVEETLGQVAVKRGPIVYCLEAIDLPSGVRPLDVRLAPDTKLRARYDQRLLGGTVVLEGLALAQSQEEWRGQLYRELRPAEPERIKLRLIPYSLWANRGAGEMSVWLPLAAP